MMRQILLAVAIWLGALAAEAAQDDPRLPGLFQRLKEAGDVAEARSIEATIWQIWGATTDPEAATLLEAGTAAMEMRAYPRALEQFNALVARQPGLAEAWNKRATLFYLMGDFPASIADIQHTLALEPRHFGALSGLGLVFMALDRPGPAIRAFQAALAIHPYLPGARQNIEALQQQRGTDL
jgi:tetratricopeptide (TPR) repeat protein